MRRVYFSATILGCAFLGLGCSGEAAPGGDGTGNGGGSGSPTSSGDSSTTGTGTGGASAGETSSTGAGATADAGSGEMMGAGGTPGAGGSDPGAGGASEPGGASGSGATGGVGGSGGGETSVPEPELVVSGPNAYWQMRDLTPASVGEAMVTVNDAEVLGDWYGFGGTFNERGWVVLKALSEADRDMAIRLLFSKEDGLGFTYGRIPIGSSDYANDRYSHDETAGDYQMNDFNIDRDLIDLIPYIKAALAVQPNIHFWASPWSPPTWMKTNNAFDRGNIKDDSQTLTAHALYLARFVEAYEEQGIHVEAIHPQNEPGYLQDYPSCGWSGQQMSTYIANYLGPLFAERLPDREIWLGTMSNPSSRNIVQTVMNNSAAAAYVSGIGVQWSQDQYVSEYVSNYQLPVMQTEHRCGNFPNGTNTAMAPNDHAYGVESWGYIRNYINYGVSSYMAWNMVLDTVGHNLDEVRVWAQNALLVVDVDAGRLIITPAYYVFRHVAQYVDPGAVRVGLEGTNGLAWKNPDGDIVAVLYNSDSGDSDTTISVGGSTYEVTIPGQGWATINWQAP